MRDHSTDNEDSDNSHSSIQRPPPASMVVKSHIQHIDRGLASSRRSRWLVLEFTCAISGAPDTGGRGRNEAIAHAVPLKCQCPPRSQPGVGKELLTQGEDEAHNEQEGLKILAAE